MVIPGRTGSEQILVKLFVLVPFAAPVAACGSRSPSPAAWPRRDR
jgi:hypothetical protein